MGRRTVRPYQYFKCGICSGTGIEAYVNDYELFGPARYVKCTHCKNGVVVLSKKEALERRKREANADYHRIHTE